MQLHYNILWIDNDISDYVDSGDITDLYEFLDDLGFEPNIITLTDDIDLNMHLDETKFDLIISDYQLNDTTGDIIIEQIREQGVMTEILFYSTIPDIKDIPEVQENLIYKDRLSFYWGRDGLLDRIQELIELTLVKLLDLNATRGIITSVTSELDVTIEELTNLLLNTKLKTSDEDLTKIIDDYITDFLDKSSQHFKDRYNDIGFTKAFSFIEAKRKWSIFRKILKKYNSTENNEEVSNFLSINKTYYDEVIQIRNKFAHAKSIVKEGKTFLIVHYEKEDFEFDDDKCIEIRKKIIQHRKNFETLKKHLGVEL